MPSLRDLILSGQLPRTRPERMWAGPGAGEACFVCERRVRPDELEFEFEVERSDDIVHAHLPCFDAWAREVALMSAALSPPDADGTLGDCERAGPESGGSG